MVDSSCVDAKGDAAVQTPIEKEAATRHPVCTAQRAPMDCKRLAELSPLFEHFEEQNWF